MGSSRSNQELSSMWNILRKLLGMKPVGLVQVNVVYRQSYNVSVAEWRSNGRACEDAQRVVTNPTFCQMLDCLRHDQIGRYAIDETLPIEQRIALADRAAGYAKCLNDLELLAKYEPMYKEIEATFARENAEPYEH